MALAACNLAAGLALTRPRLPFSAGGLRAGTSIYPWWTWVLVGVGLAAGVVVAAANGSRTARTVAAAAGAVVGARLTGTGLVAAKHWKPAFGMGGYYGDPEQLQRLALVIATAGAIAMMLSLWQLVEDGAFAGDVRRNVRRACTAVGVLVVAALPVALVAGDPDMTDLQSWGAMGLVYAGPWGAAIVLAGRLRRPASVAMLGSVAGSAALALVGPQMIDLVYGSATVQFAVVVVLAVGLALLALRRPQDSRVVPESSSR